MSRALLLVMSLGLPPGVVQAQESPPTVQESPAAAAPEVPLSGEEAAEGFSAEPAPPELPARLEDGQPIEPEITIVRQRDAVVHEYRANGRLFMVRVTPKVGKPYYLMDRDGDGRMESRMSEIYDEIAVPQWVIFSW